MQFDYYVELFYDPSINNSISIFGLYDLKRKRYYNGKKRVGDNYDKNYNMEFWVFGSKQFITPISEDKFLKFKNINFEKQIQYKNLNKILIDLGLEEHAI